MTMVVANGDDRKFNADDWRFLHNMKDIDAATIAQMQNENGKANNFAAYLRTNPTILSRGTRRIKDAAEKYGLDLSYKDRKALRNQLRYNWDMYADKLPTAYDNTNRFDRERDRTRQLTEDDKLIGTTYAVADDGTRMQSGFDATGAIVGWNYGNKETGTERGLYETGVNGQLPIREQDERAQAITTANNIMSQRSSEIAAQERQNAIDEYNLTAEAMAQHTGYTGDLYDSNHQLTPGAIAYFTQYEQGLANDPFRRQAFGDWLRKNGHTSFTVTKPSDSAVNRYLYNKYKSDYDAFAGDPVALANNPMYAKYRQIPKIASINFDRTGTRSMAVGGQLTDEAKRKRKAACVILAQMTAKNGDAAATAKSLLQLENAKDSELSGETLQQKQKLNQSIEQILAKASAEDLSKAEQQVASLEQQQAAMARRGAKLSYTRNLMNPCPDGQELVYFRQGGRVCKKCMAKKAANGTKTGKAACGKKMEDGGKYFNSKGRCK